MEKKMVRAIINKYMDFRKLLESDGYYIAPNGTMFCPFHENTHTKAAHYYDNVDGSGQIFCFAEYKQYDPYDFYTILHPDINVSDLAELIWSRLSKSEQDNFIADLGVREQLAELPYLDELKRFKEGEIDYKALMGYIHLKLPVDETINLVERLYNLPDVKNFKETDKYLYFMKHYDCKYKLVSAYSIINSIPDLPDFVYQHLMSVGDCILIPNFIDNQIYSITFRSLNNSKRFLKLGEFTSIMYNLGNLPPDFKYGTPLIIVEGNLDTDMMRQFYPYTLGVLSSNLSRTQIQLISHLTNNIIVALDNDDAGRIGTKNTMKHLSNLNTYKFKHYKTLKDTGDLVELEMKGDKELGLIVNSYKSQIRLLTDR